MSEDIDAESCEHVDRRHGEFERDARRITIGSVREPRDGEALRVLVDRLWPRGVSKERADLDLWPKDVTPSTALRKEFHAGGMTFEAFADAYRRELAEPGAASALDELRATIDAAQGVTMLLIAGDATRQSHATVLRAVLLGGDDGPNDGSSEATNDSTANDDPEGDSPAGGGFDAGAADS